MRFCPLPEGACIDAPVVPGAMLGLYRRHIVQRDPAMNCAQIDAEHAPEFLQRDVLVVCAQSERRRAVLDRLFRAPKALTDLSSACTTVPLVQIVVFRFCPPVRMSGALKVSLAHQHISHRVLTAPKRLRNITQHIIFMRFQIRQLFIRPALTVWTAHRCAYAHLCASAIQAMRA